MKKYIFLIFCSIYISCVGQQWKWGFSNKAHGNGGAVAFDPSGNLFLAGNYNTFIEKFGQNGDSLWQKFPIPGFGGTHNMVLGPDTSIFLVGNGYMSATSYVMKCDKNGDVIWNYFNSSGGQYPYNVAHSIAVDSQGNSYVTGVYEDTATFNNCTLTHFGRRGFIVKLSPQGSCLWTMEATHIPGRFNTVTIDKNDNLIISIPDSVIKISNNQRQWGLVIKELKSTNRAAVSEVNTDSGNNIYFIVSGDSVKIGQHTRKISSNRALLVKLTSAGAVVWMKEMSGPGESIFVSKAIYLTSFYDSRIQKISLDGDSVWCRSLTSNNSYFNIYNITGSNDGLIAITGKLNGMLMDGNDTIISTTHEMSPFVAVMLDTAFVTTVKNEHSVHGSFEVYPNPSLNKVNVALSNFRGEATIVVRDILGNCLLRENCNTTSLEIDLTGQPKGMYFIEVSIDNTATVKKVLLN